MSMALWNFNKSAGALSPENAPHIYLKSIDIQLVPAYCGILRRWFIRSTRRSPRTPWPGNGSSDAYYIARTVDNYIDLFHSLTFIPIHTVADAAHQKLFEVWMRNYKVKST